MYLPTIFLIISIKITILDDLITPVYVAPSHHPFTPVKPSIIHEPNKPPCDDEDCVEGSGYEPEPPEQPEISTEDEATKYSATQATELETDSNSSATMSQFTPHSNITNIPVGKLVLMVLSCVHFLLAFDVMYWCAFYSNNC